MTKQPTKPKPAVRAVPGIAQEALVRPQNSSQKTRGGVASHSAPSFATRSQLLGRGAGMFYDAASGNPQIPIVGLPTPTGLVQSNVSLRSLTRNQDINDPWFGGLIDCMADRVIGEGPKPDGQDKVLNSLWAKQISYLDERAEFDWGAWLRNRIYRPFLVDGESFCRLRPLQMSGWDAESSRPIFPGGATTPLQLRAMEAEYVPEWYTSFGDTYAGQPSRIITGVIYSNVNINQRIGYMCYESAPYDENSIIAGQNLFPFQVPASEIFHLYLPPMAGSPRGKNRLASVIIRALALQRYEDATHKRKDLDNAFSAFIEETPDTAGDGNIPGEEHGYDIDSLISSVNMSSFGVTKLPAGMKIVLTDPKANPTGDSFYFKFQLQAFCSVFRIPDYELTMDYSSVASDRVAKFATVNFMITIRRERALLARFLRWVWKNHVDTCFLSGLWAPANGKRVADYYDAPWAWPMVQTATLKADMDALIEGINSGIIDRDTASMDLFGISGEDVARRAASIAARDMALGVNTAPVAPATATTPAIPAWDPETSPLTQQMLADAEAREAEAYAQYRTDFGESTEADLSEI